MVENSLILVPSGSFPTTLSVEILHRILDKFDIQDILFSFCHVYKKFYSITNIYDRLTLELSNHSLDTCIDRLYRKISQENVGILIGFLHMMIYIDLLDFILYILRVWAKRIFVRSYVISLLFLHSDH